ncbi:MAG: hypothetical protein SOT67_00820 [Bacteroidaceae bacterium]|nr:hypothetical protein [Bacteroidaceae bacterium]
MSQLFSLWHPIFRGDPQPFRIYLSSATSEKSANCESCEMSASYANSDHSLAFAHSQAAPESEIVPAQ